MFQQSITMISWKETQLLYPVMERRQLTIHTLILFLLQTLTSKSLMFDILTEIVITLIFVESLISVKIRHLVHFQWQMPMLEVLVGLMDREAYILRISALVSTFIIVSSKYDRQTNGGHIRFLNFSINCSWLVRKYYFMEFLCNYLKHSMNVSYEKIRSKLVFIIFSFVARKLLL